MRSSSILKLTGLIALMLVTCTASFGGPLTIYDYLGSLAVGSSGTGYGDIALAQKFSVSSTNGVHPFSFNIAGSGWITSDGTAALMQVIWDTDTHALSARLPLFDDNDGDVDVPFVNIFTDSFNPLGVTGPGMEPGVNLATLTIDPAFVPLPSTLSNVLFANNSVALVEGDSYWLVLTSAGPISGVPLSQGSEIDWNFTSVPEPATLAMVGCALVLLSVRRKRQK